MKATHTVNGPHPELKSYEVASPGSQLVYQSASALKDGLNSPLALHRLAELSRCFQVAARAASLGDGQSWTRATGSAQVLLVVGQSEVEA